MREPRVELLAAFDGALDGFAPLDEGEVLPAAFDGALAGFAPLHEGGLLSSPFDSALVGFAPLDDASPVAPPDVACPVCGADMPLDSLLQHLPEQHPEAYATAAPPTPPTSVTCPECDQAMDIGEMLAHLHMYHPLLYMVWFNVFAGPPLPVADWPLLPAETPPPEDDYEALLALCESMGDHEVGVADVDAISALLPDGAPERDETCRICLERMAQAPARQLARCGHAFCAGCIETWLARRKRCPLCNQDVEEPAEDQMPPLTSESSDGDDAWGLAMADVDSP